MTKGVKQLKDQSDSTRVPTEASTFARMESSPPMHMTRFAAEEL